MKTHFFAKADRGIKDIGWLKSHFYVSFSDFYNPTRTVFGSLISFNDDFVEAGKGFGIHPHANMEIISVLLKGNMNHIDTLGYNTTVGEGAVQIMSAGTGLRHEEYNVGTDEVNFLQIWIEPKLQNINPRYQNRTFKKEDRLNRLQTIVSNEEGMGHCWINQNAKLSLGYFDASQTQHYTFNPINKCLFIFVIKGGINIDGVQANERDAIGVWDTGAVAIDIDADTEIIIIEHPINQK